MAEGVVRDLFRAWVHTPALLPPSYQQRIAQGSTQSEQQGREQHTARVVADYIAGMTDTVILQPHAHWLDTTG